MDISQTYLSAYDAYQSQLSEKNASATSKKPAATRYGAQKQLKSRALLLLTDELSSPKQQGCESCYHAASILIPVYLLDPAKINVDVAARLVYFYIRPVSGAFKDVGNAVYRVIDYYCSRSADTSELAAQLTYQVCANIAKKIPACNPRIVYYPPLSVEDRELLASEQRKKSIEELRQRYRTGFVFANYYQLYAYDQGIELLEKRKLRSAEGQEYQCAYSFTPVINKNWSVADIKAPSDAVLSSLRPEKRFVETQFYGDVAVFMAKYRDEKRELPTYDDFELKQREVLLKEASKVKMDANNAAYQSTLDNEAKYASFVPEITQIKHNFVNDVKDFAKRFEIKAQEAKARRYMVKSSATEKKMAVCTFYPAVEQNTSYMRKINVQNKASTVVERLLADADARRQIQTIREQNRIQEKRYQEDLACSVTKSKCDAYNGARDVAVPLYMSLNKYDYRDIRNRERKVELLYSQQGAAKNRSCVDCQSLALSD